MTETEILSYPRSGCTWLRKIIWHAAGIASRPRWPEPTDITEAMALPFEEDMPVDLFKTHTLCGPNSPRRILLFRDPADTIASYAQMHDSFYMGRVDDEAFATNHTREWWLLYEQAVQQTSWVPTCVVQYEQMIEDPVGALRPMFDFLGVKVTDGGIIAAVHQARPGTDRRFYFNCRRHTANQLFRASIIDSIRNTTQILHESLRMNRGVARIAPPQIVYD